MRYYQGDVERLVLKIWKKLYQRSTPAEAGDWHVLPGGAIAA
jgi:hypothetical protein